MAPPPPGLFSTTAVWLSRACSPVAISRATTSLEPPGVNGTMMRIVLLGKPCANADEMKASTITQVASSCATGVSYSSRTSEEKLVARLSYPNAPACLTTSLVARTSTASCSRNRLRLPVLLKPRHHLFGEQGEVVDRVGVREVAGL